MGTSDYDREELDFRDYRNVKRMEAARVRRAVFWWRARTWALVLLIIALPSILLAWMIWAMR